jgi:hypothetical protein
VKFKIFRIVASILLLFNGIGALYGGCLFIAAPDGSLLNIPLTYLEHSPFSSFLIPGIILFLFNGIWSITTLILLIQKKRYYTDMVIAQGVILFTWITVQIIMIRSFDPFLHITFYSIGSLLVLLGILLRRQLQA